MKNRYKIIIMISIIIFLVYFGQKDDKVEYAEKLLIPIGVGYDIKFKLGENVIYDVPINHYMFQIGKSPITDIKTGTGESLIEARSSRQVKSDKKFFLGLEKVYILSEEVAMYGIKDIVEGIFNTSIISDLGLVAVCEGKAIDIFKYPVKGGSSPSEYVEGLIKSLKYAYFFDESYKMTDIFVRVFSEGRRVILPYIEIKEEGIEVTGVAVFKEDKMVLKLNLNETKILNMLTADNTQGEITIRYNPRDYVSFAADAKRKVKVNKENNKYNFKIDLNIDATIEYDESKNHVFENLENEKIFKKKAEEQIEKECKEFIKKMQTEHKLDLLGLGRVAAAKYGRRTGVDWNDVVSNSNIDLKVNVKVIKGGRGNF
ncbi:Ger(x)C family spore germination protein [uncultured Clostridium sp.]|uniref:Ger(x)C family spore germination protein n=1 Tax=uncultured Clostridium sp. TaxID=59620 RepID=UPI0028E9C56B|nr:Ger(x)C family spore germination protein [uncultured Clostridium sp.]